MVFPEGDDVRIINAVLRLTREGLLKEAILIGNRDEILKKAGSNSRSSAGITVKDPEDLKNDQRLRQEYRRARNLSVLEGEILDQAMSDPIVLGALLLMLGEADGFIGGIKNPTAKILSTGINIIKANKRIGVITSFCIIQCENRNIGENGLLLIADTAVNPDPSVGVLCKIAEASVKFSRELLSIKPRVAFLSYSTKGSSSGKSVDKMRMAMEMVIQKAPEITVDGELQLDAAIIPEVAMLKAPDSPLKGRANTLIFPNLDAANIGSKLIQHFGNARLIGPIIFGLNKPYNDISRGADESDVYNLAIITQLQAK
ncbi:MAG: phosphate acyltransferase [Spirochaetes bacterium]|nr:phosphate acyltransferase [Spirochaetota bacterium]